MPSTAISIFIAALTLGSSWKSATASAVKSKSSLGFMREAYTTNAICNKNNCINPVFPGMEDMHRLEQVKWISSTLQKTAPSMAFCRSAISYDPALPVPNDSTAVKDLVQKQDNAASTAFYYHVAGLGMEAWDYQKPEEADDCIKSIWRMVCFTYFPRAELGVVEGGFSTYIRPCRSSCTNYVRMCNVECCDESVQCSFEHEKSISPTQIVKTQGYIPHDGPSSLCTGAARRSTTPLIGFWALVLLKALFSIDGASIAGGMRFLFPRLGGRKFFLIGGLVLLALSVQGCNYDVPIHRVGNWRSEPDYLIRHEFIPPGGSAKAANINSCSLNRLSMSLQCSGRGSCKLWNSANPGNTLSFCECDTHWADPECRTPRKSQAVAYVLSLFLGMFGADQFYLGFTQRGLVKLFTLGGMGVWWIVDIIRIGSAPVFSNSSFRVAADLPHFAYVLSVVMFALFLGFVIAYQVTTRSRAQKRKERMMLTEDEERQKAAPAPFTDAYKVRSSGIGAGGRQGMAGHQGKLPVLAKDLLYGAGGYGSRTMGPMPPTGGLMPMSMGTMPMANMKIPYR